MKPFNKRLQVEIISKSSNIENSFEIPKQFKAKEERHLDDKYLQVKIVDMSDDIKWVPSEEFSGRISVSHQMIGQYGIIETFCLETFDIDGKEYSFVPLQGLICYFDKGKNNE